MRSRFFAALCVIPVLLFSLSVLSVVSSAQQSYPAQVTALRSANLRAGPGTDNAIVGGTQPGQKLQVSACNAACDWYQVGNGQWIAAFLVQPVTGDAPIAVSSLPTGLTPATVIRIVDGDTIHVLVDGVDYPLRYIGMDTAEVGQPTADEATATNSGLVSGQTLYLEKDVSETDRYERLLRYVWLADGRMVNELLVLDGCAVASTYQPDVKYQDRLRTAQQIAVAAGRTCGDAGETTPAPPAATATSIPAPTGATCTGNSNLRGGAGTNFPIVGRCQAGQRLEIVGRNPANDWLNLADGAWIASFLVSNPPTDAPVVESQAAVEPLPTDTEAELPPPPPATPAGQPNIIIETVYYDGGVYRVESDEFAVIANVGNAPANIGGWLLNAGDNGQDFGFPNHELAPGQSCRVYTNEYHPDSCGFSFGSGKAIWNNKGDCGLLYDANRQEVSRYCY